MVSMYGLIEYSYNYQKPLEVYDNSIQMRPLRKILLSKNQNHLSTREK